MIGENFLKIFLGRDGAAGVWKAVDETDQSLSGGQPIYRLRGFLLKYAQESFWHKHANIFLGMHTALGPESGGMQAGHE